LRLGALAACGWRLGTWSFGRPVTTRPVLPMPRYKLVLMRETKGHSFLL
jgi:hypothetical protein